MAETGRSRSINRKRWKRSELDAILNDSTHPRTMLFAELNRLIQIRRQQPAFHPNATQYTLHLGDPLFSFWRESLDRVQSIFAIHNISSQPQKLSLAEMNLIATEKWRDLLSGQRYDDLDAEVVLPPYAAVWLTNH
jgi:sucrose phosphorylase